LFEFYNQPNLLHAGDQVLDDFWIKNGSPTSALMAIGGSE
jgi:hypothetical protein